MFKFISVFILSLTIVAHAQVVQRNILAKHYSIEQIQQTLIKKSAYHPYPLTVSEWNEKVSDTIINAVIKGGESYLNFKFEPISLSLAMEYKRTGDRAKYEAVQFKKRKALLALTLAESMENKGRFMEQIANGVWSICEESFWGVSAHIGGTSLPDPENPIVDLFSAETAAILAITDYLMGNKFDTMNVQIRRRIYYETNRRIFEPMLHSSDNYFWMSRVNPVNNWNPWIVSNWVEAILLLENNEERRVQMFHKSMTALDAYLNSLGEDGGCDEGPSYWFAAGASTFDCLETFEKATNHQVNIFKDTLIQKMGAYIYKVHIDGKYFVNFADADPTVNIDGLMLYRFGNALKDSNMIGMGQWAVQNYETPSNSVPTFGFFAPRFLKNILTIKNINNTKFSYSYQKEAWLKDVQVMTARSSNGFFMATHGGHNGESHNHNDVGDFILYAKGEPIIIDAGRGNYTARTFSSHRYELWFTQSQYHNLPVINGSGQLAGTKYAAKNLSAVINPKEATLKSDLTDAYDIKSKVSKWEREVKLDRVKNQLNISESYLLKEAISPVQENFITVCKVDISQLGKIKLTTSTNQLYYINYDAKQWSVITDYPSTDGAEYSSFKTKWGGNQVQRIQFTKKEMNLKGNHVFSITDQ